MYRVSMVRHARCRPTASIAHARALRFTASSSASLAAYLNSLTYTVEEAPSWFFQSKATGAYKIRGGAFCSFNAFSRVDVRVEVKIPGGVEAYVIDLRGER